MSYAKHTTGPGIYFMAQAILGGSSGASSGGTAGSGTVIINQAKGVATAPIVTGGNKTDYVRVATWSGFKATTVLVANNYSTGVSAFTAITTLYPTVSSEYGSRIYNSYNGPAIYSRADTDGIDIYNQYYNVSYDVGKEMSFNYNFIYIIVGG